MTSTQPGPLVGRPGPTWASWDYSDTYLPREFYKKKGKGSLSDLMSWIRAIQIVTPDDTLGSYGTLERIALGLGLAMRDIFARQFVDDSELPDYVVQSPFEFRAYENLSHIAEDVIDGFEHLFVISAWAERH